MEDTTATKLGEELRQREAIARVLADAGRLFLTYDTWHDVLPEVLPALGKAVEVNTTYVLQAVKNNTAQAPRLFYEWINREAGRMHPAQPVEEPLPESQPPEETLEKERVFKGRVSQLPYAERKYFQGKGVESFLIFPIFAGKEWWGLLGFGDISPRREWSTVEEYALELVANLVGAAIEHQLIKDELRDHFLAESEQRQFAQVLGEIGSQLDSTLDIEQVLDMLLDQIIRVAPYDSACVILVEGEKGRVARWRGYDQFIQKDKLAESLALPLEMEKTPNLLHMFETRQPMVISNIKANREWKDRISSEHIGSWAGAPIIVQGKVVAFLSLDKIEPGFYTEKHPRILEAFTSQAALAMQNANTYAEVHAALQREHTLNEMVLTISSDMDLPSILQNVARLAIEMVNADACVLGVLDEKGENIAYEYGINMPKTIGKWMIRPDGLVMGIIKTGKSISLPDYSLYPNARKELVEAGTHAFIGVPLMVGIEKLGALTLQSYNPEIQFDQHDLLLIESVGRQIAVAVKNAYLFENAKRRAREAETLRKAASAVASNMTLKNVVNSIQVQLAQVVPFDSSSLFLVRGNQLYIAATSGPLAKEEVLGKTFPLDDPLFEEILSKHNPIILDDAQTDPRFNNWAGIPIRGWMAVPLITREQLVGFLTLDSSQETAYTPADANLVQAFANEAAMAVDNARLFEQVQHMAITDPLTDIYNRRYFFEVAEREFQRSQRYGSPLSIILMDIDYFKKVNDTYGHLVGDDVLRILAQRFQKDLREVDLLARYGGEEFAILLPETDLKRACQVARRVQIDVQGTALDVDDHKIFISVSFGCASVDENCRDLENVVNHADKALYGAKTGGRGEICTWEDGKIEFCGKDQPDPT